MAFEELNATPDNIWAKRNMSWVLYDMLKAATSALSHTEFIETLEKINTLELNADEVMFHDKLAWAAGKMIYELYKELPQETNAVMEIFQSITPYPFVKPSEGYSYLFKMLHKSLKDTDKYLEAADWWGFDNFREEDFSKEKLPDGKEIMALAEQAYIAYAKNLLPVHLPNGEVIFNEEKARAFISTLEEIEEKHPEYIYPPYFRAKLIFALGVEDESTLQDLIPFIRKKKNDFWAWEVLSELYKNDPEIVFSCYCRALTCMSPEEMLVGIRERMAEKLIDRGLYDAAKTEIDKLVKTRISKKWKIPFSVTNWMEQDWYHKANNVVNNNKLYKENIALAEGLLYSDSPEVKLFIEFVNKERHVLNFISEDDRTGFIKYDRFLKEVSPGDVLKVRFQSISEEGRAFVFTMYRVNDDDFRNKFIRKVEGEVHIPSGKEFGFIEGIYIHPALMKKFQLKDKMHITGSAIKSFNPAKKEWGWKLWSVS